MDLEHAVSECERWLEHLDGHKRRTETIARIAAAVRKGHIGETEAKARLKDVESSYSISYDAARLEEAVKFLIKSIKNN